MSSTHVRRHVNAPRTDVYRALLGPGELGSLLCEALNVGKKKPVSGTLEFEDANFNTFSAVPAM